MCTQVHLVCALAQRDRALVRMAATRARRVPTWRHAACTLVHTFRTLVQTVCARVRTIRTRVQIICTQVVLFHARGVKCFARGDDDCSMADYIPRSDAQFGGWAKHYVEAVSEFFQEQGLDDPMLLRLQMAYGTWVNRYTAHVAAQNAARAATENKDEAREALEEAVRPVTNFVQSYPATTDADRANIGISIRPPSGTPSTAPRTAPQATVQSPARLTHELRLVDTATPTRSKKPRGVLGAEVWVKFVDADQPAPTDPAALTFLTMTTRPTLRAEFKPGDGGKTAVYMARWVSTRGEKGPWSDVATATVAA